MLSDRTAALWSLVGVCALFGFAIVRLGGRALNTLAAGLTPGQWVLAGASTVAFVYFEGVLALQRRWVPRLIERARELRRGSPPLHRVLAPLYAMSLIGASARHVRRAWTLLGSIVLAVLLVGLLDEPWRGIIDLAVAMALAWGVVSIVRAAPHAFAPTPPEPVETGA